jgi:AbiJ N-terminal domain 4
LSKFKLWSKRQQQPQANPDVYQYDVLPDAFRRQVVHILVSTLGAYDQTYSSFTSYLSEPAVNQRWKILFSRYIREIGVFRLSNASDANACEQCVQYLLASPTGQAIDFIDCAFQYINQDLRQDSAYIVHIPGRGYHIHLLDAAIEELNQRFQEHQIGYQFQNGQLIKQTDQYLHEEVMLPALTLLSASQFRGAQDEFLSAHRHYREHRYKEAVTDALKAFESTMKSILDEQGWEYKKERDAAKNLLQVLFDHQLIPTILQKQFVQLRDLLESGLPTIRNKMSGHGQGTEPVVLPKYIAEYALHIAAANIVFLVQAYEAYKRLD